MAESYQFIFIFLLIFTVVVEFYLGTRQKQFVLKNKIKVPEAFAKVIKLADHKKAADYIAQSGVRNGWLYRSADEADISSPSICFKF